MAVAGSLIGWLRDNLGIIGDAAEVEALARSVPDSGDVVFVPAFSGLFAPHWRSDARGVIAGLTRYATRGPHRPGRARGDRLPGLRPRASRWPPTSARPLPDELRVDGGMIRNELLMQFQADILGRPVVAPPIAETSALGAAYAAGLAVGFWSGLDELRGDGPGRATLGAGDGRGQPRRPGSPAGTRASSARSAGSSRRRRRRSGGAERRRDVEQALDHDRGAGALERRAGRPRSRPSPRSGSSRRRPPRPCPRSSRRRTSSAPGRPRAGPPRGATGRARAWRARRGWHRRSSVRSASPSDATDAVTWALRLEVAIAQRRRRASIAAMSSPTPGSGRGARLSRSYRSPESRSIASARASSIGLPASAAISLASRLPSRPMSGASCARVVGVPASASASSQAAIRVSTVSMSVPSRSNTSASGSGSAARLSGIGLR